MKKLVFLLSCCFVVSVASAQSAFYYCNKGGRKLVSDTPCNAHGAKLTKKVSPKDLYPISSSDGLSESARNHAQQITNRMRNEELQHQRRMQESAENFGWEQQRKKETCDNLYRQKESVTAQQRVNSTPYLNERQREINDQIYKNGC